MTTEELYEILGDIDERCVKEAKEYRIPKKRIWRKWGAIAACLCLVAVGTFIAIGLLGRIVTKPNDIQGTDNAQRGDDSSSEWQAGTTNQTDGASGTNEDKDNSSVPQGVTPDQTHNASETGDAFSEDGIKPSGKTNRLVINTVKHTMFLDMDVQIMSFRKQDADAWASAVEDFHKFAGITYKDFTGRIPDTLEQCDFYSVSTRGYRETGSLGEYTLHDYVFNYQTQNGGRAKIAICSFEAPLRDCLLFCDNPEKSEINGVSMKIYGYQDTFIAQFSYNGINYGIETNNMAQDGLAELLTCIVC